MDLLDRYLQAVQFWLPKKQKEDIIAELSEDLRSQMEEKEAELGRKLEEGEIEAILKRCGSPLAVATRYLPQRYLIGPGLFPLYRFALAVVLLGCVAPRFLIWFVFLMVDPAHRGYLHMENMWSTVVYLTFFTTLAFALVERSGIKLGNLDTWNPRKLPPVRSPNRILRSVALAEIAGGTIFTVWFAFLLRPRPVLDLYSAQITLAPIWTTFYWSFLAVWVTNVILATGNLFRPYWTRRWASLRLLSDAVGLSLFCWLFHTPFLIGITIPSLPADKNAALTTALTWWMPRAFPFVLLLSVVILADDIYRIIRLSKQSANPAVGVMAGA